MEKPAVGSPFFGAFPSDRIPKARMMSVCISLFTAANPENYTGEFQERFEATT